MYVQMLECQAEYFQHAANQSKRFQRDIDYYRKQYPKTNDFASSNGQSAFSGIDRNHNSSKQKNGSGKPTVEESKSNEASPKLNVNSKKQVPQSRPSLPSLSAISGLDNPCNSASHGGGHGASNGPTKSSKDDKQAIPRKRSYVEMQSQDVDE